MSIAWLQKLRDAGLTQAQAEAIASMPEERYAVREQIEALRDHVDARFSQLETSLTWRILGIAGLVIVIVGLLDKFVRP